MWYRAGRASHHLDQGRRVAEAAAHRRRAAQAHHLADKAITALAAHPTARVPAEEREPAIGYLLFSVPRRGQDGSGRTLAQFMSAARSRWCASICPSSLGKALGLEADRFASGICGLREGGQLTERVKRAPYSAVLLTKSRSAPDVFNILLQVFEDGQLTTVGQHGGLQRTPSSS